jgi:SAM-dependent methyltransferase
MTPTGKGPPSTAPTTDGLANQATMGRAIRYNRWLIDQVRPWAGRRLLDAGCAVGNLTCHWLDRDLVVAVDLKPDYLDVLRRRLGASPNLRIRQADLADPRIRDLDRFRFDTVACFNVLEHVEDDERTLSNFHALLQPGGALLLMTPACPWLYGTLDAAEHHVRRYGRAELRDKVRRAGFRILRLRYMNVPGLFGWFVNGRILRRRALPARQVLAYDRVIPLVAAWERIFAPPVGQSLVLVARRS